MCYTAKTTLCTLKKKKAAEKSAAGDYAQTFEEGFEEYRRLREQGYSKEEETKRSLLNTGVSLAGDNNNRWPMLWKIPNKHN